MSARAAKSGIAAEAQQKIHSKFEPALAHEILCWVVNITGMKDLNTDGNVENFVELFKDGTLLCKLANSLAPNSIKKINTSAMAFKQMENISFFLEFASKYIDKTELFQTVDLYEAQDPNAVLVCLSALARKANKLFNREGLGPKEADAEKRVWSQEQLRAGDSVIGLQMGSNKGASQAGMIMGNTRHM